MGRELITCTTRIPTPPDAPVMRTFKCSLPPFTFAIPPWRTLCKAVKPDTTMEAPSSADTPSGRIMQVFTDAIAYLASEPPFCELDTPQRELLLAYHALTNVPKWGSQFWVIGSCSECQCFEPIIFLSFSKRSSWNHLSPPTPQPWNLVHGLPLFPNDILRSCCACGFPGF